MSGRPSGGGGAQGGGILEALAGPLPSVAQPLGDIGPPPQASFNEPVAPEEHPILPSFPTFSPTPALSGLPGGPQSLAGYPSFLAPQYAQPDPRRRFQFF